MPRPAPVTTAARPVTRKRSKIMARPCLLGAVSLRITGTRFNSLWRGGLRGSRGELRGRGWVSRGTDPVARLSRGGLSRFRGAGGLRNGATKWKEMSDDGPHAEPDRPQRRVHHRGAGTGRCLGAVADRHGPRGHGHASYLAGGGGDRGRGGAVRVVCLELRGRGAWHARPVGRAAAGGGGRPLPLGAQPDLHRRAAGRAGGGVPVRVPVAAGVCGRDGGLLPPVRHRVRGTRAAPPLRRQLPGLPAGGPALDPASAAADRGGGPMSLDARSGRAVSMSAPVPASLARVRRASLVVFVLLLAEYGIGMYVNLYVTVPAADHGHSVGSAISNGPVILSAHAVIGLLLGLSALAVLVLSIIARRPGVIVVSAAGLIALAVASMAGSSFTSSGQAAESMAMSVTAGVGLLCYAATLSLLPSPGRRG